MNNKEINYLLDNMIIDEHEFDHIDIELNSIERKKIKKNYKNAIIPKWFTLKKASIACALTLIIGIATPVFIQPVMATNLPILSNIYEFLGVYKEYKDYSTYIGKSITASKYTYTINNIVVTPYHSLTAIKITSTDPIPKNHQGFMVSPNIHDTKWNSGSSNGFYRIDDYNMVVFIKHNYQDKIPRKSTIKINIHSIDSRDNGINSDGSFEFKADFDKSYSEFCSIPIKNTSIDKFGVTVQKINSSILGTDVVSQVLFKCKSNNDYAKKYDKLQFVLNVDGKIYGSLKTIGPRYDNGLVSGSLITTTDGLNFNAINNSKNLSLLVYESKYTDDECYNLRESSTETIKQPNCIEEQNVCFTPYFEFSNNRKGEFYGLERNKNTVRLHYKGKPSDIVPLSQMHLWYEDNPQSINSKVSINPNNENDFTIEFINVPENKKVNLNFYTYKFNDYTLLDTVKIK